MARGYAQDTKVPIEQSIGEILGVISNHGIKEFGCARTDHHLIIWWDYQGRRFQISEQGETQNELQVKMRGKVKHIRAAFDIFNMKGQIEALYEFMILPNGQYFREAAAEMVSNAYEGKSMPKLIGVGQ